MFHKLIDVFISMLIFILGIALMLVLMNYALSHVVYNVIVPNGYPFSQMEQLQLFHRDFGVNYLSSRLPYQSKNGFGIDGGTSWALKSSYFAISNPKPPETKNYIQGFPASSVQVLNYSVITKAGNFHTGSGSPYVPNEQVCFSTYYGEGQCVNEIKGIYMLGQYYLMTAGLGAGYYLNLYRPAFYPAKTNFSRLDSVLYDYGLLARSVTFKVGEEKNWKLAEAVLGGLEYLYAPVQLIGYTPSESYYSPSYYVFSVVNGSNTFVLKTIAYERKESSSLGYGNLQPYFYVTPSGRLRPLIFGSTKNSSVFYAVPDTYFSFYTIAIKTKDADYTTRLEYKVSSKLILKNEALDTRVKNRLVAVYYVVGNPLFSVQNGQLVLMNQSMLYEIAVYDYPHASSSVIVYKTPVFYTISLKSSSNQNENSLNKLIVP